MRKRLGISDGLQTTRNPEQEPRNQKKRRISGSRHQSHIHPNNSKLSKEDASPKKHRIVSLDEACDPFSSNSTIDNEPPNGNISGNSPSVCPLVDSYTSQPLRVASVPQITTQNAVSENKDATTRKNHSVSSLDTFHPVSPNSSESHGDDQSASSAACTPGFSTSMIPQLQDGKDSVEPPQLEISQQATTVDTVEHCNLVKPENTETPSPLEVYEPISFDTA
jgi:hypothetical protein